MTAVMTVATVAGPIGFIVAGIALQHVSLAVVFVAVAAGMLLGGIAFAAVLLRAGSAEGAAAGSVTMPDIAHG
jgi:hypothetical protein